jgi:hypothetical protein
MKSIQKTNEEISIFFSALYPFEVEPTNDDIQPQFQLVYFDNGYCKHAGFYTTDRIGLSAAVEKVDQLKNNYDVYFSTCLHDCSHIAEGKRVRSETARYIIALWLDLDIKDYKSDNKHNYPTEEQYQIFLREFPIKPSITVYTGGGYHCWWIFKEPIEVEEKSKALPASWITCVKQWFQTRFNDPSIEIDSTGDLARILRPAGTINHKYGVTICS